MRTVPSATETAPKPSSRRSKWTPLIWICCLILLGLTTFLLSIRYNSPKSSETKLESDRGRFRTKIVRRGPSPDEYPNEPLGKGAIEVRYRSGDLQLRAWITPDPGDGKRRPAVVFLHGNFFFWERHWDIGRRYADSGFVLMTPMVRGENGNPGDFEFFYGEVDDVVGAGRYVANLPYVDPDRVYLSGHSVGGTLALLGSMVRSPYAAVASFSGWTDQRAWLSYEPYNVYAVFDTTNPTEFRLRSPKDYVGSIACPLLICIGDAEGRENIDDLKGFAERARGAGKACQFELIPGDHGTSKGVAIYRSIEFFNAHRRSKASN